MTEKEYIKKFYKVNNEGLGYYPSSVALLRDFGSYIFKDYLTEDILTQKIFKYCENAVNGGGGYSRDNILYVRTVGLLEDMKLLPFIYRCASIVSEDYGDNMCTPVQAMEVVIGEIFVLIRKYANKQRQEWLEKTVAGRELTTAIRNIMFNRFKEEIFFGERRETTVWEELNMEIPWPR